MMRLLAAALSLGLASQAYALGTAESAAGNAAQAFSAVGGFKLRSPIRRLEARTAAPKGAAQKVAGRSKYVSLRGFVHVSGQSYVSGQGGYVWITVSGNSQLQDNNGNYINGSVTVTDTSGYFVNGSYVSGWPRPSATVTLYRGGRYLGSIRVDGSIPVSGYNSGGWVRVSGSGWVEGSGTIYDADEPQAP